MKRISDFKKVLYLILFVISSFYSYSQDYNHYKEIKSEGELPLDYILTSFEKYEVDKATIGEDEKRRDRKQKEQFYLESNYSISDLVKSGNIIFNDTISNYLSLIYNNIQKANPILKDKDIRFYLSKSTIVNAFATHAGVIIINIGLVAKVESEDELAYIMCHEISHFLKNHSMKQYTFSEELDSNKGEFKEVSWEEKMFSKANYSQDHEMEADSLGLVLYLNTDYSKEAPMSALNNLKTYYLPFYSDFNFDLMHFNEYGAKVDQYTIVDKNDISIKEYEIDSLYSTHPDIDSRVKKLTTQLYVTIDSAQIEIKDFLPNRVQTIAQFELTHLFMEKGLNYHSLYSTMALLDKYDSEYLEENFCKSIYMLSQDKTYNRFVKRGDNSRFEPLLNKEDMMNYESKEVQQIYQFFSSLTVYQLNVLSIQVLNSYCNKCPEDYEMRLKYEDLIISNLIFFKDSTNNNEILTNVNEFNKLVEDVQKQQSTRIEQIKSNSKGFSKKASEEDENGKCDIDKLIFLNPESRMFDLRKEDVYKYKASEDAMIDYIDCIELTASSLGLDYEILSSLDTDNLDVELINDIADINTFLIEETTHSPWTRNSTDLSSIIKKYDTDKIALVGTYSFQEEQSVGSKVGVLIGSIVFFPFLPLGIMNVLTPMHTTFTYVVIYDVKSEMLIHYDITPLRMAGNMGVINTTLYNSLYKIKYE